ncbi:MAG: 50S ribosomal protein L6 [Candidatus Hydrogenedentes bacterium]|nr:50S ribosomal protein L6 [Candidatus Hydrogenedentota bacterium]
MSRVGKTPIPIPDGVKVDIGAAKVKVDGPKGSLEQAYDPSMSVVIEENEVRVSRSDDKPDTRAKHGLTRALINNMVQGVTQGFEKTLEIQGVGWRASMEGKNLSLALGHSHPVKIEPPYGIEFTVEGNTTIKVSGIDKQQVGQVAANVRAWRKPEPYKGKGIRYRGEYVRRKVGKAGTK